MANKIYNYEIPAEYIYDSNKIEINEGIVSLKEDLSSVYARYHLNEDTNDIVLDTSGNERNGTPINSPISITGKLNNCLQFNGINQFINCGDIANFERNESFSIEMWIKYTNTDVRGVIGNINTLDVGRGWQFYIRDSNLIGFQLRGGSSVNAIHITVTCNIDDNIWHHVVFVYNGNSSAYGISCYIDSIPNSITVLTDGLTQSIISNDSLFLGMVNNLYFLGNLDEVVIYNKVLSQEEITYKYNLGIGTEKEKYYSDNPNIQPSTSWEIPTVSTWFGFNEILGEDNEGNIGYNISDDEGITWYYWNGINWISGGDKDHYNISTVIGANISSFSIITEKILLRAFLISNGIQQCELDENEIVATTGHPPNVYAGINKITKDHQTIAPFSDAVISDIDGNIENAHAYYQIEESGYIEIEKGGYGTLQEAIRSFEYTFENIGEINCELSITDEDGYSNSDDLTIIVEKYTVTFNVKNQRGEHLINVQIEFGDGTGSITLDSPFIHEYEYSVLPYICTIDKSDFTQQIIEILSTDHIENITLQWIITPETIADAVWNELINGHVISGSFGEAVKNTYLNSNSINSNLSNLEILIKRIIGLSQENYKLTDIVHNNLNEITSAKIKIYPTAEDCNNETNEIAIYNVVATYDGAGKLLTYKVIKT